MPIVSWLERSLWLLAPISLAACAAAGVSGSAPAPTLAYQASGPAIRVTDGSRVTDVPISIERASIDPGGDQAVRLIHRARSFVVILDEHASRPQSLSRCQAGREVYARVLALSPPRERFARLVESCLQDVVPGDPPVAWQADDTLAITIVSGSAGSGLFRVHSDGTVTPR